MLNHARTLLLNRSADYFPAGGVHIPDDFHPVALHQVLTGVRNILFPHGLDPDAESYIADMIVNILHASDLEVCTLLLDSRTTYRDIVPVTISDMASPTVQIEHSCSGGCDIVGKYAVKVSNYPKTLAAGGTHSWVIRDVGNRSISVTPSRGDFFIRRVLGVGPASRTDLIPLIGGYIDAFYELPSQAITGAFRTTYTTFIAPNYNIGDRLNRLDTFMTRAGRTDMLFGGWDPYKNELSTLRATWMQTYESILRFGSLITAYVLQVERLRRLGG